MLVILNIHGILVSLCSVQYFMQLAICVCVCVHAHIIVNIKQGIKMILISTLLAIV